MGGLVILPLFDSLTCEASLTILRPNRKASQITRWRKNPEILLSELRVRFVVAGLTDAWPSQTVLLYHIKVAEGQGEQ